ncbi:MAG: biotin carboxylase N-terminal domain-containing protein [Polyangiaceae bacterium]
MAQIQTLLIANRGEIAARIQRTARTLGIRCVQVYSDADAGAPFVLSSSLAVRLGPAPSRESYLDIERIIAAARKTGADAIHPGFGFLAENAAFAQAVLDAGLTWVGPSPAAISAMGLKREAKRLVQQAGVPVIPGGDANDQAVDALVDDARRIGLPVLIKASAGGGGKGMRIVRDEGELPAAIEAGKREALGAFGDDTILIEKYIDQPRHVELQILGDSQGNLVHLFERECSIQRRHQKIVEEAPSPAVNPALREKMGAAALAVGRAVHYTSAGTVEFILAPDGNFYFLEVNTRLQVEHPVTELVTGVDLVAEQLRVAEGHPLSFRQEDLQIRGAAVEVRLYAEDATSGFLPTTGRILEYEEPDFVRVDSGIHQGSEIGIHYDPMLAKVIAHGETRSEAVRRLRGGLREFVVLGVVTNREFLMQVLAHPEFLAGNTHTHFIDQHAASLGASEARREALPWALLAATLFGREMRRDRQRILPALTPGYANNRFSRERIDYGADGDVHRVEYAAERAQIHAAISGREYTAQRISRQGPLLRFEANDGVLRSARVAVVDAHYYVQLDGHTFALTEQPRFPSQASATAAGACIAPMPGKVVRVEVAAGDTVAAGQTLLILEAMKMEHSVKAAEAGTVEALHVAEGDQVEADAVLAVITSAAAS